MEKKIFNLNKKTEKNFALLNANIILHNKKLKNSGLLIENKTIKDFGDHVNVAKLNNFEIIDCKGLTIAPGIIDLRVQIREPGQEHKETIKSASKSAVC